MLKNIRRSLLAVLVVCLLGFLLFAQNGDAQQQKSFLWKVQSKTTTVYILGSIHFLRAENYPLNPVIEEAFERSAVLAVEANVSDLSRLDMKNFLDRAMYPEDDSLEKHISEEVYRFAEREIGKLGLPLERMKRQRPWVLALTLEAVGLMRLRYDPKLGIDMHFLSKARGKKSIIELESMDGQINMLASLSDVNQELLLLYVLKNMNILGRHVDDIVKAWSVGDVKTIESIDRESVREEPKLAPIFRTLIFDRNKNMLLKIDDFLKSNRSYFIVVGAGHLVGKEGIINMLKERGYLVEQL